ncbi:hypothetical protein CAEBREN_32511 [Caenorhabditis brenneri]|uniref:Receptor L-domain domain-containing protein n=1 Tax=Caenorhabditis brenneri TaxID=135651 RepID=G0MUF3_CAEBE|nr:hypothetical protein CAEBREN_32511 [Caenorhabditis brenneri]
MLLYFLFVSHTFAENFTIFQSDGVNCDPKCEFKGSSLTSKTLPLFPTTCSRVCGDLEFFENCDLTEQQLTTAFINLKRLIGGVKMIDTNFTSAKFLGGVEYIECGYNMQFIGNNQVLELSLTNLTTLACTGITVSENDKMKHLNIPNLKNLIPITPSHPEVEVYLTSSSSNNLCITTEEMKLFLTAPTVDKISVKYCDPVINGKMCKELAMGCVEIFGDVEIKSDYQLTLIKDVEVIYGSLTVDGTNVTDLRFLEKLEYVATLDNPKCTFEDSSLTRATLPNFPTSCSTVCAEITIKKDCDLTEQELTTAFLNMKVLIGGFLMRETNLTSAKFLAGLESIECLNNMQFIYNDQLLELGLTNLSNITGPGISVTQNKKLRRLNMPNLKYLVSTESNIATVNVHISNEGSPDFCLTTDEMKMIMSIDNASLDSIFGKYCDPVMNGRLCKEAGAGCVEIIGDVEVTPSFKLQTMKDVEIIYGSLIINGTNLTDLSFLPNLKYVATLDHNQAILIENNFNLTNITFPQLKRIRSKYLNSIVLKSNNRILSNDSSYCYGLRKELNLRDFGITIDGSSCESKCTFNVPLPNSISSKTIANFPPPSCSTVCADIVIDEGCDLTEQQLTMIFQNMKKLIGGFTMVSTSFTSVKFLAGLESIECYDTDMMFLLNKQLLELGLTNLNTVACPGIHVATNTQMKKLNLPNLKTLIPTEPNSTQVDIYLSSDSPNFCITIEEMKMFMSMDTADVNHIFGKYCDPVMNGKTCETPAAGCVEIIGDVEVTLSFELETMKDVEAIYGSLIIKGTTLTDFSFLPNLKYVATLEQVLEKNAKAQAGKKSSRVAFLSDLVLYIPVVAIILFT